MPNATTPPPLPPRPTRTEAPQLTTVSPVDFNDRGGPPLTSAASTSSTVAKPSLMDDYRLNLKKRTTPQSKESTPATKESTASPVSKESTIAPASESRPNEMSNGVAVIVLLVMLAIVVLVVVGVWKACKAIWKRRTKRMETRGSDVYEGFKAYRVTDVNTVAEFLAKYYKRDRYTDRGGEYAVEMLAAHQASFERNGFDVIIREDSNTGEVVSFYGA